MGRRRGSRGNPQYKSIPDRAGRALLAVAKMLAFDPHNLKELHAAAIGAAPPVRRNPAHLHAEVNDPGLREVSERFHGTDRETAVLDDDQRPPREVAVVGQLEGIVYKPDRHSKRGGTIWEHEAGDQGEGQPKLRSRGLVVTDGKKVWAVPGNSETHFDPERGIVG